MVDALEVKLFVVIQATGINVPDVAISAVKI
jgi:hypothetical protein